jgi:hypothetical protein
VAIKPQTDLSKFVTHRTTFTKYTETGYNKSFMAHQRREANKSSRNRERDLHRRGKDGSKQGR